MTDRRDMEWERHSDNPDLRAVHAMEREVVKQDVVRKSLPWIVALIVVLLVIGTLLLVWLLLPVLVMRGST